MRCFKKNLTTKGKGRVPFLFSSSLVSFVVNYSSFLFLAGCHSAVVGIFHPDDVLPVSYENMRYTIYPDEAVYEIALDPPSAWDSIAAYYTSTDEVEPVEGSKIYYDRCVAEEPVITLYSEDTTVLKIEFWRNEK